MIGVWQLSIIEFNDSYLVRGVILRNPLPHISLNSGWLKSASYVVRSYFRKPLKKEEITVVFSDQSKTVNTDKSGAFQLVIKKPFTVSELKILYKNEALPILQEYPTLFTDNNNNLVVISDVDETILQSFTSKDLKRISTTLFKSVNKRKTIDFTEALYDYYADKKARFFYVSKSESNLFHIITSFISSNNLPLGAVLLTNYLSALGLFKSKEKDFKFKQIETLIGQQPTKHFVLVGDDSQHDPNIYTRIAQKYEKQIVAVYIRNTRKFLNQFQKENRTTVENTKVPFYIFNRNQQFSESFVKGKESNFNH